MDRGNELEKKAAMGRGLRTSEAILNFGFHHDCSSLGHLDNLDEDHSGVRADHVSPDLSVTLPPKIQVHLHFTQTQFIFKCSKAEALTAWSRRGQTWFLEPKGSFLVNSLFCFPCSRSPIAAAPRSSWPLRPPLCRLFLLYFTYFILFFALMLW